MAGEIKTGQIANAAVTAVKTGTDLTTANLATKLPVIVGRKGNLHARWAADSNPGDTITVTVGATPTVFTAVNPGPPGPGEFVQGGGAPVTANNFATAVNGAALGVTAAKNPADNAVDIVGATVGQALDIEESSPGGPRVFVQDDGDEAVAAQATLYTGVHTCTNEDVTRDRVFINTGLTSIASMVYQVRSSATGIVKAHNGAVTITNGLVDISNSGATDFDNGDTITLFIVGV